MRCWSAVNVRLWFSCIMPEIGALFFAILNVCVQAVGQGNVGACQTYIYLFFTNCEYIMSECFGNIWVSYKGFGLLVACFVLGCFGYPPKTFGFKFCHPIDPN